MTPNGRYAGFRPVRVGYSTNADSNTTADTNAPIIAEIVCASGGSDHEWMGDKGLRAQRGLFLDVLTGSLEGAVWIRTPY